MLVYPFPMKMQPSKAGKPAPSTGRKRWQMHKIIWKEYTSDFILSRLAPIRLKNPKGMNKQTCFPPLFLAKFRRFHFQNCAVLRNGPNSTVIEWRFRRCFDVEFNRDFHARFRRKV